MTHLRKMMLEERQRRNYSENTTRCYIRTVEDFARRFNCSPDRLGPRHIREYQAELFEKRKLSAASVAVRLAALRIRRSRFQLGQQRLPSLLFAAIAFTVFLIEGRDHGARVGADKEGFASAGDDYPVECQTVSEDFSDCATRSDRVNGSTADSVGDHTGNAARVLCQRKATLPIQNAVADSSGEPTRQSR